MLRSSGDWIGSMQNMQKEMERLLNYFGSFKPPSGRFARMWEPAVDIYETEREVVVLAELPGVKQDDIEVMIDNNYLVIRGQRKEAVPREKKTYYQLEIHRGPFERRILLPTRIDHKRTKATHEDGILEIILAKMRQDRTLRVDIKNSDRF